jgi:hypothetical protein
MKSSKSSDPMKETIQQLEKERDSHKQEMMDLEAAIRVLRARLDGNGNSVEFKAPKPEISSNEFGGRSMIESAVLAIEKLGGEPHLKDIYKAMMAGGFRFTGPNPKNSLAATLRAYGRTGKRGIQNKKGNRFSVSKTETE